MTDDLAEAKRHIRALMEQCAVLRSSVYHASKRSGRIQPTLSETNAKNFLDAEGQRVEPELTCDFQNAFPDGTRDISSYDDIETALDRADAPVMDGKRWLKLPERITAFAAELTRLKSSQAEHDRTVRERAWIDVDEAIDGLHSADTEFRSAPAVYANALRTIHALRSVFPAPKVWAHGPESVVLDWGTFLLTISADKLDGRLSTKAIRAQTGQESGT